MQSKKIFFLANANSIHTVKWVDYFVDNGYEVHLATFSTVNDTKCENIYFLSNKKTKLKGGNYHYLWSIWKLSKILSDIKPDIINAHYSYSMGLIAFLSKKISRVSSSLSVVCHGSDILAPPYRYIFDILNKYILNKSDKVFAVSDQIKDKIESFGVDVDRIFVGQYGLNIQTEQKIKDIDILSNRTYHPNSRIEFLLDALAEAKCQDLRIIFILSNIPNEVYDRLVLKYPYVTFYQKLEHTKMIHYMSRTKIYISATKSDGTSLSLLEAMGLGCIPLVSNIVSNRSWVLDGINGYLFDNKKDFLLKLDKIINMKDDKEMKAINNEIISEKATYVKQMKKIEEFLL